MRNNAVLANPEIGASAKVYSFSKPKQETNKKKGQKSEVYPYQLDDLKRILNYFAERNAWTHYLALTFGCNMARRIGDILSLKWENIYFSNGMMRNDILEIVEQKTDKLANPHINKAVKDAIKLYIEKTGCDPAENDYQNMVFMQLTGTHKGAVLSESGHLKAIKKAQKALNIEYNIGTHSARKFFGMTTRQIHPGDYDSMEMLRAIYNHSDTKTTSRYIGLTKQKIDTYYDDMGDFFTEYVLGEKEFAVQNNPTTCMYTADLIDVIKAAYKAGRDNAANTDAEVHMDALSDLLAMIEELKR